MPGDDIDSALAATATALNEDAKAARKRSGKTGGAPGGDVLVGDGSGQALPAVETEPTVGEALADLGASIEARDANEPATDLSETAHQTAIERQERMATEAALLTRSLVPDVRDFLLDQIKARPKPWSGTSNQEQRDVAAACEHAASELVRKVVEALASEGREPIRALLTKFTHGDDIVITAKVKAFSEEESLAAVVALHRAQGKHVMITVASKDDYTDGPEAETDDDQPPLDFAAPSDDFDNDLDPD